jgi:hypothetical protein
VSVRVADAALSPIWQAAEKPAMPAPIHPFALRHRAVRILKLPRSVAPAPPPVAGVQMAAGEEQAAEAMRSPLLQRTPVVAAVLLPFSAHTLKQTLCVNYNNKELTSLKKR